MFLNLTATNKSDLRPIGIPETQLERYISFRHALNLRFPDEDTGDWHFLSAFFYRADQPSCDRSALLAGSGEAVDTTRALGARGVRDMAKVLLQSQIPTKPGQPVYVANHFRAIADIAMMELQQSQMPRCATNNAINSWLDTSEQIEHLKINYLNPLEKQLPSQALKVFKEWINTVNFA